MALVAESSYANLPTGKYRMTISKVEMAEPSKAFPDSGPRIRMNFEVLDEDRKKIDSSGLAKGEKQTYSISRFFGATLGKRGKRSKLFDCLARCLGDDRREDLERWITSSRSPSGNTDPEWWMNCEVTVYVVDEAGQDGKTYTSVDLARIRPLDGDGEDNWATVSAAMKKHDRELFTELFGGKKKTAAPDDDDAPAPKAAKPATPDESDAAASAEPQGDFSF